MTTDEFCLWGPRRSLSSLPVSPCIVLPVFPVIVSRATVYLVMLCHRHYAKCSTRILFSLSPHDNPVICRHCYCLHLTEEMESHRGGVMVPQTQLEGVRAKPLTQEWYTPVCFCCFCLQSPNSCSFCLVRGLESLFSSMLPLPSP